LYSLITDYFLPSLRGKIYGLLQISGPLGYLVGMVLGILLSGSIGWRGVFYLTGSLGIFLAILMFLTLKEPARGQSEPELADQEQVRQHRFDEKQLLENHFDFVVCAGFFGVFPGVITYWFFNYLEANRMCRG
jgi:MFS family permease